MFLVIIAVSDPVQFIGWIVLSYVYINDIMNSFIRKLLYYTFCIKIDMNRVPLCAIGSILSLKLHVVIVIDLLVGYFKKTGSIFIISHSASFTKTGN